MKKLLLTLTFVTFLCITNTAFASPAGDNIIISEVAYDPIAPDQAGEWVEFYNPTTNPIDISGWSFTDGESTITIPALTPAISAGGYFIAAHTAVVGKMRDYPTINVDLEYNPLPGGSPNLANGGDELSLSDAGAGVVDSVSWGGGARFNISAIEGATICRGTATDTDLEGDWINNCISSPSTAGPFADFIITVKTDNPGTSAATEFTIPTAGGGYNYNVDCDNDDIDEATAVVGNYTCDYTTSSAGFGAGTYTVRIKDNTGVGTGYPQIRVNVGGDPEKLIGINQWGTGKWRSMRGAFWDAVNLNDAGGFATDSPDLSAVTDMRLMFTGAAVFNQNLDSWDTSNVIDMGTMFSGATVFNGNIGSWDTSSVTDMSGMFQGAIAFNQNIENWETTSLLNMSSMFSGAIIFNQDISFKIGLGNAGGDAWNVGSVTNMTSTFQVATAFNKDIGNWDTGEVLTMNRTFADMNNFNQNIGSWDTAKVGDMSLMFANTILFDQNLELWNVSSLTVATNMFNSVTLSTTNYDALLNGWNAQVLQNGTVFSGGNSKYCLGEAARTNMKDAGGDNWTITDGGKDCVGINQSPTDIQIDTNIQNENTIINSDIGTLTTTDPDGADTHSYTLACSVPGADDAHFNILGDKLRNTTVFDFETPADADTNNIYQVCIRTTDNGIPNKTFDEIITIIINDIAETSSGSTKKGGSVKFICKDETATNYNPSKFGRHKESLCKYDIKTPITKDILGKGNQCSANIILTQNLKAPARNGSYHSYTKATVTEAKLLQAHMNRLGFKSGPEDGIIGPLTEGAIKRMQVFLGTTPDGYIGPITRGLINNSCGTGTTEETNDNTKPAVTS